MKQTLRNLFVFSSFGLTCLSASGGCSSDPSQPIGVGNGATAAGGSAAGTFGTSGTATGGSTTAGSSGTAAGGTFGTSGTAAGGTFGTSGTDTGGTFGTSGTATGGTFSSSGTGGSTAGGGAGGAGGTSAGTGGAGGTGGSAAGAGGGATDFPANCPAPTGTHGATPLTKTCWVGSATDCSNSANNAGLQNPPSKALDADAATRFSTGAKMVTGTMFKFDIDMGKAVMINGVASTTPPPTVVGAPTDNPPFIEVDVSTDGNAWTPVACGANSAMADISFAAVSARYVRFVEHGTADSWWSLADVNVYAAGADTTCGAGGATPACTSIGTANAATCCGMVHTL